MTQIDSVLKNSGHRPWSLPLGPWRYYQEWNDALFLHWKVPIDELTKLIPKDLTVDTFDGEAWISLVAFKMERIRPRYLPAISVISDFYEINVRTYVTKDNKSGVYFLNIEAEKQISCFVARLLSGLPYTKANISTEKVGNVFRYSSTNRTKGFYLDLNFTVDKPIAHTSGLHKWLTERYCLYLDQHQNIFRYETHHEPWKLYSVKISNLKIDYQIGNIPLAKEPAILQYSPGVKVLAWRREYLSN